MIVVGFRLDPTFSSQLKVIQKQHWSLSTFEVLGSRDATLSPYWASLTFTYVEEQNDMMTSGSNQARDELATTIHMDNKCLNLGTTIGAHLGNLGGAASNRLNYIGLVMNYD
jgi:hypothetical protein